MGSFCSTGLTTLSRTCRCTLCGDQSEVLIVVTLLLSLSRYQTVLLISVNALWIQSQTLSHCLSLSGYPLILLLHAVIIIKCLATDRNQERLQNRLIKFLERRTRRGHVNSRYFRKSNWNFLFRQSSSSTTSHPVTSRRRPMAHPIQANHSTGSTI